MKKHIGIIIALLVIAAAAVLIITKPWDSAVPEPIETAQAQETPPVVIDDTKDETGSDKGEEQGTDEPEPSSVPLPEDLNTFGYAEFHALSPEQKDEFLHSFEDYEAFYNWYVAAQAAFVKEHPDIEIGPDGSIDLSELAP